MENAGILASLDVSHLTKYTRQKSCIFSLNINDLFGFTFILFQIKLSDGNGLLFILGLVYSVALCRIEFNSF